jgi:hypothetical protein
MSPFECETFLAEFLCKCGSFLPKDTELSPCGGVAGR